MLPDYFVFIGIFISFLGGLSYFIDTIKGIVKPNRVSWFIWALAPLIAFVATIDQGVGVQSLLTFIVGFNPLLVFIGSFMSKEAAWKINRFDIICGSLSIVGIILWYITQVGNIAILCSIIADGLASLPTIIKSWKAPETESYKAYLMSAIGSGITLLTVDIWEFEYYAFPLYILLVCFFLFILIKFRVGKQTGK